MRRRHGGRRAFLAKFRRHLTRAARFLQETARRGGAGAVIIPTAPLLRSRTVNWLVLGSLACTLGVAAAAARPLARGTDAPPPFPDAVHVANGCHLSTLAYLARFARTFPHERGEPLIVAMRNADGATRPHTIALVSWRGQWWGRDEYFGVFPLDAAVAAASSRPRLIARAETALERHAHARLRDAQGVGAIAARGASLAQRLRDVTIAAALLPHPAAIFWVRSGAAELPLLLFRTSDGHIALYDPAHGTCWAESTMRDDARFVALAAERLGYRVASVRADVGGTTASASAE